MRTNPLIKEGLELISDIGFRRIYGSCLLILSVSFFLILPVTGPGSGASYIGPPPIFISMATVSAIACLSAVIVSLSRLTGRAAEAGQWFLYTGGGGYAAGKAAVNLVISILYGVLLLPFLMLAAHFEALPLTGALAAAVYLTLTFLSYGFLMEIAKIALPGKTVVRRILLWVIFCFNLLLTSRIAPDFNPVIQLSVLNQNLQQSSLNNIIFSSLKAGILPLYVLLPVFLILTFLKAGRRLSDG